MIAVEMHRDNWHAYIHRHEGRLRDQYVTVVYVGEDLDQNQVRCHPTLGEALLFLGGVHLLRYEVGNLRGDDYAPRNER